MPDETVRLSDSNRAPAEDRSTGQCRADLTQKPAAAGAPFAVLVRPRCCFSLIIMAVFFVAHGNGFQLVEVRRSSQELSRLCSCYRNRIDGEALGDFCERLSFFWPIVLVNMATFVNAISYSSPVRASVGPLSMSVGYFGRMANRISPHGRFARAEP